MVKFSQCILNVLLVSEFFVFDSLNETQNNISKNNEMNEKAIQRQIQSEIYLINTYLFEIMYFISYLIDDLCSFKQRFWGIHDIRLSQDFPMLCMWYIINV